MTLDLSALDEDTPANPPSDGKPLRASLDRFYEDPDQPRKDRDAEADDRDRKSIKDKGVMQPIVAAPPGPDGRMRIIFGARRHRLSGEAGLTDIPYFLEDDAQRFDDYAQVAENEHRSNLSPLSIALFIQKRKAAGDTQKRIAAGIGMAPADVTYHAVLVDGPDYIRELYSAGKCKTPKYLYELANAAKENPEKVELWCAESNDFTRSAITAFIDSLKVSITNAPKDSTTLALGNPLAGGGTAAPSPAPSPSPAGAEDDNQVVSTIPSHNPDNEKPTVEDPLKNDSSKIKKPLLLGTYKGTDCMILLNRRPTTPGLVHIKYENGTGEEEVEFGKIKNLTLTESTL